MNDWFSRPTPLQLAMQRGTAPGGDLEHELHQISPYTITSQADAEAICGVLQLIAQDTEGLGGPQAFRAMVGLFQEVESTECPAFGVLSDEGITLLGQILEERLDNDESLDPDDALFALKMLAMYGTWEGTEAVIRAARRPVHPEGYLWSVVLAPYANGHPEAERLFEDLADPLPEGFLAIALLDSANAACLNDSIDVPHPFDSDSGVPRLEEWLLHTDEEQFSYAVSATAALPFLEHPERDRLLDLAGEHASSTVQIEAAWAAAKLGREEGVQQLAHLCREVNLAQKARSYLEELGRADAIPPEADDPHFHAKADFAEWLAHPNELGRPPDELRILDHRILRWPPERQEKPFWLIEYLVRDTTGLLDDDLGVGLVGSVTFCLFYYHLQDRSPEDGYAIHAAWEMIHLGLIETIDVSDDPSEYDGLLEQAASLDGLSNVEVELVAEMSAELEYPQTLVAVAAASRGEQPGWLVIDGPRSRWYGQDELLPNDDARLTFLIHVGRTLLDYGDEPDRGRFKRPEPSAQRSPPEIIAAYEQTLKDSLASERAATDILGPHGVLSKAFPRIIEAYQQDRELSPAQATIAVYERLLDRFGEPNAPESDEAWITPAAPLMEYFVDYSRALVETNQAQQAASIAQRFGAIWKHPVGRMVLAETALAAQDDTLAEEFLVALREELPQWPYVDQVDRLAEVWVRQDKPAEAEALLVDALTRLAEDAADCDADDREHLTSSYQQRRATFITLFGESAAERLDAQGLGPDPFGSSP